MKRSAARRQAAPIRAESCARSHVGTVRSVNEDRFLALDGGGLWAVADGMGGHFAGDLAAEAVIGELERVGKADEEAARAAIERANRRLFEASEASFERASGTTVVALLIHGSHYRCLWAGDSELWLLRDGALAKLTRDHSVVEELVQAGVLAEADRRKHPQANIITRAIGADAELLLDSVSGNVEPGDVFLLCSDGLTGAVTRHELEDMLPTDTLDAAADALLERALANGASDNVTLVLVRAVAG